MAEIHDPDLIDPQSYINILRLPHSDQEYGHAESKLARHYGYKSGPTG